jgi:hypothetical protein
MPYISLISRYLIPGLPKHMALAKLSNEIRIVISVSIGWTRLTSSILLFSLLGEEHATHWGFVAFSDDYMQLGILCRRRWGRHGERRQELSNA